MQFLLLFLLSTSVVIATPIEVSIDRALINLNESFDITFSSQINPDKPPDFSPLADAFEILNKHHGSSISWLNGKRSMKIEWKLTVMAKKAGQLQIPAIDFGNDRSPIRLITVTENKQAITKLYKLNAPLFLEVAATPKNPYLQSQVIYTVRFFSRINIEAASLADPKLTDAVVEKLGEDSHYRTERNGLTYLVTERHYALFPQKSGSMVIEPLVLTASVLEENDRGLNSFFRTQRAQRKRITSEAITLAVRPIPTDFKGKQWLAATEVTLSQQWSTDHKTLSVGEPLTRTLRLMVKGSTLGKLPQLQPAITQKDLKAYPDQPVLQENKTTSGIISLREEKIALIAASDGTYTLPKITLDWFNINTEKMETATLPAITLTAIGEQLNTSTPPKLKATEAVLTTEHADQQTQHNMTDGYSFWQGLSILFASGWLITLFFFFKQKISLRTVNIEKKTNEQPIRLKSVIKALKRACDANDVQATKQALLTWGQINYGVYNLGQLTPYCNQALTEQILTLNQNLYSQHDAKWNGKALFQLVSQQLKTQQSSNAKKIDDQLEPLYRI
jgi:hypothetical protein